MTFEDGSSLSQSETHLKVFENLVESDCTMLRDIVNNQLIPRMVKHGFPIKGLAKTEHSHPLGMVVSTHFRCGKGVKRGLKNGALPFNID